MTQLFGSAPCVVCGFLMRGFELTGNVNQRADGSLMYQVTPGKKCPQCGELLEHMIVFPQEELVDQFFNISVKVSL